MKKRSVNSSSNSFELSFTERYWFTTNCITFLREMNRWEGKQFLIDT